MLQFLLVTLAWVTVYGQNNLIYDGGTISSYHVRQINQTFMRMHMVVQTGWKLGNSACGTTCALKEVTYNNTGHVRDKTGVKLGKWMVEVGHGTSFDTHDITDYVKNRGKSHVIAQNSQDGWELEITEFDYDIDMTADYTDITLSGPKWRAYSRGGTIASPETDLQIKLQPHIRNDTGLPNGTPFAIFRPVYRIELNKVSIINLAPVDPDGDAVICEPAAYVSAGGIRSPSNITIHKDCRVEIAAMESLGYTDDGWDAVAVVMSDYNREPIVMEANKVLKPYFRYLSQVSLQFMLHTVKTVDGPAFMSPTPVDKHVYTIEVNSLLKFKLAATGSSDVDTFHVSTIPYANVALTKLDSKTGEVQWRPQHSDVGTYVMQVRATDVNGMETDERTFVIEVRDREPFTLLQHPSESVFAFVPTLADFHCAVGETCIIAIPVVTSFKTTTVRGEGNVDLVDWHGPFDSIPNTFRYQADVKLDGLAPGSYVLCLNIDDTSGTSPVQKKVCVDAIIDYRDPCENIPCMHYGECIASQGNFTCNCLATYTGSLCEQVIDACNPSPCVNGKCYNTFSGAASFYCQCTNGFSGDKCDIGSSIAPKVTSAAATPSTGPLSGSSTAAATSGTTVACADKVGVNCNLLATATQNFCATALAPKYCLNHCSLCLTYVCGRGDTKLELTLISKRRVEAYVFLSFIRDKLFSMTNRFSIFAVALRCNKCISGTSFCYPTMCPSNRHDYCMFAHYKLTNGMFSTYGDCALKQQCPSVGSTLRLNQNSNNIAQSCKVCCSTDACNKDLCNVKDNPPPTTSPIPSIAQCMYCDGKKSALECTGTQSCSPGEHCYIEVYGTNNNELAYYAGCVSETACAASQFPTRQGNKVCGACCDYHRCDPDICKPQIDAYKATLLAASNKRKCFHCFDQREEDVHLCTNAVECSSNTSKCSTVYRENHGLVTVDMSCEEDLACASHHNRLCGSCCDSDRCNRILDCRYATTLPPSQTVTFTPSSSSTTVTTQQTVDAKGVLCEVCSGSECDVMKGQSPSVRCPDSTPYCLNTVVQDSIGNEHVTKRCGSVSDCDKYWLYSTAKMDECINHDPTHMPTSGSICTYCCVTTNCNRKPVPEPDTRYNKTIGTL